MNKIEKISGSGYGKMMRNILKNQVNGKTQGKHTMKNSSFES